MTKIKTSQLSRKRHFNLNSRHITTMDFMHSQPVYYRRLIPGQKISVDVNSFTRLADMPVPTFGEARLRTLAFFVPYRTVDPYFNGFIGTTLSSVPAQDNSDYVHTQCIKLTNNQLCAAFFDTDFEDVFWHVTSDESESDFYVQSLQSYVFLSRYGSHVYKTLCALGYDLNPNLTAAQDFDLNILDLLSFLRVHLDWLYARSYVNDADYHSLEMIFSRGQSHPNLAYEMIRLFENFTSLPYGANRYTDAFDSPIGPNVTDLNMRVTQTSPDQVSRQGFGNNSYNNITQHITTEADSLFGVKTPTPSIVATSDDGSQPNPATTMLRSVTQSQLNMLSAMSTYIRRNQVAGSRAFERMYALFGIKPDADVYNRSYYIGSYDVDLQVSDVMSTSDTDGARLGSYAGRGFIADLSNKNGHFEYDNDSTDFGVFMLVSYIEPKVLYGTGIDPMQLQTNRFDFFTGDYDGITTEPIRSIEVTSFNHHSNWAPAQFSESIFGFTPIYSEYKVPRDCLSGDFRLHSRNRAGITSRQWHFQREFTGFDTTPERIKHNKLFVFADDAHQFDRIFYNTSESADHFVSNFLFKVDTWMEAKPLYAFEELEDEKDVKSVDVPVEGIQLS